MFLSWPFSLSFLQSSPSVFLFVLYENFLSKDQSPPKSILVRGRHSTQFFFVSLVLSQHQSFSSSSSFVSFSFISLVLPFDPSTKKIHQKFRRDCTKHTQICVFVAGHRKVFTVGSWTKYASGRNEDLTAYFSLPLSLCLV